MPEILEVESYRKLAALTRSRLVAGVRQVDAHLLRGGISPRVLRRALTGREVVDVRRRGKLLLVDLGGGPVLGLHFGMTGRLEVDGRLAIDRLEYSSARLDPAWVRLRIEFDDGGALVLHDQRRFGAVELDPPESLLGPDAIGIDRATLRQALGASRAPLKARLLDQRRVAGLGNLLVDEILWRAGLDPTRSAGGLSPAELTRLHRTVGRVLQELAERGGSHRGDLQEARVVGARCPRDGAVLRRAQVGGRTTYWCPEHQR